MLTSIWNFVVNVFDHLLHFWVLDPWGVCLYYTPAALCLIFYFGRSVVQFNRDFQKRRGTELTTLVSIPKAVSDYAIKDMKSYKPTITYGTLLGRFCLSIIPVVNIFSFFQEVLWEYLTFFGEVIEKYMNTPLVPDTEAHAAQRAALVDKAITTSAK